MYAEHINELMERARCVRACSQDEHGATPSWMAAAAVAPCSRHGPTSNGRVHGLPELVDLISRCLADLAWYQKWQALKHPALARSTSSSATFHACKPACGFAFPTSMLDLALVTAAERLAGIGSQSRLAVKASAAQR